MLDTEAVRQKMIAKDKRAEKKIKKMMRTKSKIYQTDTHTPTHLYAAHIRAKVCLVLRKEKPKTTRRTRISNSSYATYDINITHCVYAHNIQPKWTDESNKKSPSDPFRPHWPKSEWLTQIEREK